MARCFQIGINHVNLGTTGLHFSAWSYWAWVYLSPTGGTGDITIFGKGLFGSSTRKSLALLRTNPAGHALNASADAATTRGVTTAGTILRGGWYFCGCSYDDAGDRIPRIILGTETSPADYALPNVATAAVGTLGDSSGATLYIGAPGTGNNPTGDGSIWACGVASRVLSLEEFERLRLNPLTPTAGCAGQYVLGFATEPDFSGAGHPGTVSGTFETSEQPCVWVPRAWRWDVPTAAAPGPTGAETASFFVSTPV